MPKNAHEVWPFAVVHVPLKPTAFAGLNDGHELVWMVCASGWFAIPLQRDVAGADRSALAYIKQQIDQKLQEGGRPAFMADHTAPNNNGVKRKQ
ncbi:MAG: hypothetical protein AAF438_05540 [Pseudomonadota bacterium]